MLIVRVLRIVVDVLLGLRRLSLGLQRPLFGHQLLSVELQEEAVDLAVELVNDGLAQRLLTLNHLGTHEWDLVDLQDVALIVEHSLVQVLRYWGLSQDGSLEVRPKELTQIRIVLLIQQFLGLQSVVERRVMNCRYAIVLHVIPVEYHHFDRFRGLLLLRTVFVDLFRQEVKQFQLCQEAGDPHQNDGAEYGVSLLNVGLLVNLLLSLVSGGQQYLVVLVETAALVDVGHYQLQLDIHMVLLASRDRVDRLVVYRRPKLVVAGRGVVGQGRVVEHSVELLALVDVPYLHESIHSLMLIVQLVVTDFDC